MLAWFKQFNWNLLDGVNWRDFRPLREPVLWAWFVAMVVLVVVQLITGEVTWYTALDAIVTYVLALFGRAQVTPPLLAKS